MSNKSCTSLKKSKSNSKQIQNFRKTFFLRVIAITSLCIQNVPIDKQALRVLHSRNSVVKEWGSNIESLRLLEKLYTHTYTLPQLPAHQQSHSTIITIGYYNYLPIWWSRQLNLPFKAFTWANILRSSSLPWGARAMPPEILFIE